MTVVEPSSLARPTAAARSGSPAEVVLAEAQAVEVRFVTAGRHGRLRLLAGVAGPPVRGASAPPCG